MSFLVTQALERAIENKKFSKMLILLKVGNRQNFKNVYYIYSISSFWSIIFNIFWKLKYRLLF